MNSFVWWMLTALAFALILLASWGVNACEMSGRAVLAKGAPHATWRLVNGSRCWFAGYPKSSARLGRPATSPKIRFSSLGRTAVPMPSPRLGTQDDLNRAWYGYDQAAMFLNLLLFGTLCPIFNTECNFAPGHLHR